MSAMTDQAEYPLVLTLTFDIRCAHFAARVISHGRALMAFEDSEWWCHGVDPGGLTACAENPALAFPAFKEAYEGALLDLAADAGSFDKFKLAVEGFVSDTDTNDEKRWLKAREEIRAGTDVDAFFNDLKRVTDNVSPWVVVESLDKVAPGSEQVGLAEAA